LIYGCSFCLKSEEIRFIEKLRIGSEETSEEMFFKIIDARSDAAGNIFIVDSSDNSIKKFSKAGMFLNKAGKRGQGPGELNTPLGADLDKYGTVYVNDYGNRRINVYSNNLEYIETISLQNPLSIEDLYITLDGCLLIFCSSRRVGDKYFNLFSRDGALIQRFFEEFHPFAPKMQSLKELRYYGRAFAYLSGKANISLDKKKLAFSHELPENPYRIFLLDLKGNVLDVIQKRIKGYNPQKQKERLARLQNNKSRFQAEEAYAYTTIRDLHFSRKGYLIIERRDEVYKNGAFDRFIRSLDVFSPEGRLAREGIKIDGDIMSIDLENNAYIRIEPEDGIPRLAIYSLEIN
jgi:hypothetical protein